MTVLKLTRSLKAMLVIDDEGNVFVFPLYRLEQVLKDKNPHTLIMTSRMPLKVQDDRFKPSPLWVLKDGVSDKIDGLLPDKLKKAQGYSDKVVPVDTI